MRRGRVSRLLAILGLTALACSARTDNVRAQGGATCTQPCEGGACQWLHCPSWFHHCQEQPPCIRIHCGCARPVCNPCNLPNFGYFQTCWTPWPLPPDWSHCGVPRPAALVHLQGPPVAPGVPSGMPVRTAPAGTMIPPAPVAPPGTMPPEETEQLPRPVPFVPPGGTSLPRR
jgi:hypothetical protein